MWRGLAGQYSYRGKVALVTGGASGIGRALSRALAQRGASVIVADIDGEGAREVAREASESDGDALGVTLDVRDRSAWEEALDAAISSNGHLDILINNAGVACGGEVSDMSEGDFRRLIDVNVWGVLNGSMAAIRHMKEQGYGRIVNMASMYGLFPAPVEAGYALTKHAVVGFSTSLRTELLAYGIKVSVVCPGVVDTPIWARSPVLGVDREAALKLLPFRPFDVDAAAKDILRGVSASRAIVVFPLHAKFVWWLYRLSPDVALNEITRFARAFQRLKSANNGSS